MVLVKDYGSSSCIVASAIFLFLGTSYSGLVLKPLYYYQLCSLTISPPLFNKGEWVYMMWKLNRKKKYIYNGKGWEEQSSGPYRSRQPVSSASVMNPAVIVHLIRNIRHVKDFRSGPTVSSSFRIIPFQNNNFFRML